MHPPTDSPATSAEVSTAPPGHSLLSMALMLLLAAAVLAGVRALYHDPETVVQRWNFAEIAPDAGPWIFPAEERGKTPQGIAYVAADTGPGPELTQEIDAARVGRIRLRIDVTRVEDGMPIPFVAEWRWSSPEELTTAPGEGDLSGAHAADFFEPDRHQPDLRELNLRSQAQWRGKIEKSVIVIKLPGSEAGPYRIETRLIEFLE